MKSNIIEISENTLFINGKEVLIDDEGRCSTKMDLTPQETTDLHNYLSDKLISSYNKANS